MRYPSRTLVEEGGSYAGSVTSDNTENLYFSWSFDLLDCGHLFNPAEESVSNWPLHWDLDLTLTGNSRDVLLVEHVPV